MLTCDKKIIYFFKNIAPKSITFLGFINCKLFLSNLELITAFDTFINNLFKLRLGYARVRGVPQVGISTLQVLISVIPEHYEKCAKN